MAQQVKVTVTEKHISVMSPYNAAFVAAARQLGGKFDRGSSAWIFDPALETNVRAKLTAVYGTDGSPSPTTTVLLDLDVMQPGGSELVIGPITVLKKWDRDQSPVVGTGCAVVAGALKAHGGSRNNPDITWQPGTIVRVTGVPQAVADKLVLAGEAVIEYLPQIDPNALTGSELQLVALLQAMPATRRALVLAAVKEEI